MSTIGATESSVTLYKRLEEEPGVRRLVDRFYDLMDLEPSYHHLRSLHPTSLDGSRDKLFWFLCGWLGGPNHFETRFGHPRLKARHMPYAINSQGRDEWLNCMRQAMNELSIHTDIVNAMWPQLAHLADWMRNQAE